MVAHVRRPISDMNQNTKIWLSIGQFTKTVSVLYHAEFDAPLDWGNIKSQSVGEVKRDIFF